MNREKRNVFQVWLEKHEWSEIFFVPIVGKFFSTKTYINVESPVRIDHLFLINTSCVCVCVQASGNHLLHSCLPFDSKHIHVGQIFLKFFRVRTKLHQTFINLSALISFKDIKVKNLRIISYQSIVRTINFDMRFLRTLSCAVDPCNFLQMMSFSTILIHIFDGFPQELLIFLHYFIKILISYLTFSHFLAHFTSRSNSYWYRKSLKFLLVTTLYV